MPSVPPFAKRLTRHRILGWVPCALGAVRGLVLAAALTVGACADDDMMGEVDRVLTEEAKTAEANHDYGTAIHRYGILYQSSRDNPVIIVALARNQRHGGQAEKARQILEDAVGRLGPKPALLLEKGKAEISAGHPELALDTLNAVIKAAPETWEAPATLAIALDRLGRYDEAAAQYRIADRLNPDNPDIYNNFALSRALAGEIDEAIAALRKAVALKSAPQRIRENLAFLEALKAQPPRPGRVSVPAPRLKAPLPN